MIHFYHPHLAVFTNRANNIATRATVALTIESGVLSYGIAFCSTKDKFAKRKGRELATKRLVERPQLISLGGDESEINGTDVCRWLNFAIEDLPLKDRPSSFIKIWVE